MIRMGKQKISNVQANVIADGLMNLVKENPQFLNLAIEQGLLEAPHVEKLVALAIKGDPHLDEFKYDKKSTKKITKLVNDIISQSDLKALVQKKAAKVGGKKEASVPATLPTMIQSDGPIKANFDTNTGHVTVSNYGADNMDVTCSDGIKAVVEPLMDGEGEPTGDYDVSCPVPEASSMKTTLETKSKKKK